MENISKYMPVLNKILIKDWQNWTPLYHAVYTGNIEMVDYLLSNKVDVTVKTNTSWNVYHLAANNGYVEILQALVMHNNDNVNDVDKKKWTPLYHAVHNGHIEIVNYLLSNKVDVTIKTETGWNVYHLAANNGYLEILQALVMYNNDNVNDVDKKKWTPLYHAVYKGHIEMVNYLLSNKADVTVKTWNGSNVYHSAAFNGNLEIMMALIESSCDSINEKDKEKRTPLSIASYRGHKNVTYMIECAQLTKK